MPPRNPFEGAKFDVEHALDIYADSFCTFPAAHLYEKEFVETLRAGGRSFHIYLIGYVPKVTVTKTYQESDVLCSIVSIEGKEFILNWKLPKDATLKNDGKFHYIENSNGERWWISESARWCEIHRATGGHQFKVKYIGQAFGSDGSRNALDRLLKHETLQKIAVKGVPKDHVLQVLLLEIQSDNRVFTVFLPEAEMMDDHGERRKNGLDKLLGTTDAERVSLYEAALIRYFSPEFNKEFKNSFPSTNLKILTDC